MYMWIEIYVLDIKTIYIDWPWFIHPSLKVKKKQNKTTTSPLNANDETLIILLGADFLRISNNKLVNKKWPS